jgi:hypothetical protein
MLTRDKIIKIVHPAVIESIDKLTNSGDIETLKKWLVECETEIKTRQENKQDAYSLFCEKDYLLNAIGN